MTKIWFNHWFSQAYHFMKNLKTNTNNYIIATNERYNCVYRPVVDEFYVEPVFQDDNAYVDWCLEFCRVHNVDVFFPRRGMDSIASRASEFEKINVKLILDTNVDLHNLLQSKLQSCEYIKWQNLCNVPLMIPASTCKEFYSAYQQIKAKYGLDTRICIKKDKDEGAQSFKRIYDDTVPPLYKSDIYYKSIANIFTNINPSDNNPYIVMPYMDEPEVSVDCLRTNNGFIAIPRYKESARITRIDFDEKLIDFANKINDALKIQYPYNIQFRKLNDVWMFMEINTRMAGGSFKATAVGCDFASLALKIALNETIDTALIKKDFQNKCLGNIEQFVDLT